MSDFRERWWEYSISWQLRKLHDYICLSNLRTEHLKWVNLLHVNYTSINLTLKLKKIFLKSPPPPKMASPPMRSTSGTSSTFQPGPQPWYLYCNWFLSYNANNKQLQSQTNCSFIKAPKTFFTSAFPLFLFCPHHYLHLPGLLWQPWSASLLEWPVPLLLSGCIRNVHFLMAFSCLELTNIPHSLPIGLTPPSPHALTLAFFFILIYHHPDTKTRQRHYKKRKLQTNITDEYRCKNPQQNTSKQNPTTH